MKLSYHSHIWLDRRKLPNTANYKKLVRQLSYGIRVEMVGDSSHLHCRTDDMAHGLPCCSARTKGPDIQLHLRQREEHK